MIEIGCTSREMDADFLHAPGGFAWWYVDLIAPDGDGLVLIFSYGLPFLPGYAAASRRGQPQLPLARPSVNVAAYERGRESFYLLQEYGGKLASLGDPGEGVRDRGRGRGVVRDVRIGRSRFASRAVAGRRVVEATLDCALPGSAERLTGTVRVEGVARQPDGGAASADTLHLWTPLTGPAVGEARLDIGGRPLVRLRGRAYHDRNGGRVPLHELGIGRWMWGRFPLEDRELIYYLNWPARGGEAPSLRGLTIDEQGITHDAGELTVELGRERRGRMGLRWPETIRLLRRGELWALIRHAAAVDDGPFYVRLQSELTTARGERALGWSEICEPDRVDLARHRPLVRMRVHRAAGRNSIWLPLFAGRRRGRITRWARSLVPRGSG